MLNKFKKNKSFQKVLKESGVENIESVMITPVQQIPRHKIFV